MFDDLFDYTAGDNEEDGTAVVRLHVQPGAGKTAVVGRHGDAIKVRVAAPPEGGRANDAVVALVAQTFDVKLASVSLVSGQTSRAKRVQIDGVAEAEVERLLELAMAHAAEGGKR
ncbi:MAG: YggU family protein [Actinobacteria bacterium]|nr:YggU family protein [Actinomycetota bacterium]